MRYVIEMATRRTDGGENPLGDLTLATTDPIEAVVIRDTLREVLRKSAVKCELFMVEEQKARVLAAADENTFRR